jgi:hypothetical protein
MVWPSITNYLICDFTYAFNSLFLFSIVSPFTDMCLVKSIGVKQFVAFLFAGIIRTVIISVY